MKQIAFVLTLLSLLIPSARAQEAALPAAPSDALVYLSFKGTSHLGPAYDTSHLKAVADASNFSGLYHELMPQLLKKAMDQNPESAQTLANSLTAFDILSRHGFSLYFTPKPEVVGLTCDAGDDVNSLQTLFQSLSQTLKPDQGGSTLQRHGTVLTLLIGNISPTTRPAAVSSTLAATPAFQSALKQVASDPIAILYIDVEHLLPLLDQLAASDGPNNPWVKIKPLTGLSGLKRYILTGAFDADGNWSTQSFAQAPVPRNGWLALSHGDALPASLLSHIPADSTYVRVGHFDPAGWIDNFRQIAIAAGGPPAQQKFDQILGIANLYVGRNLTTDVLAPLGADWAIYSSSAQAIPGQQYNLILMSKVADEAKANAGLTALTYALANTAQNPRIRAVGVSASASQDVISDLTVTSLKLTLPSPQLRNLTLSWAIKSGNFFLGFSPKSVTAAAGYAGPAFPDSPEFASARKRLSSAPSETSFEYANILPANYQALHTAVNGLLGIASMQGLKASINPLPAPAALTPHLSPILRISWSDADGFHSKSVSPFPGAAFLTPSGLSSIGGVALGVSVALPSINRARETANRVKCASNMKQIGSAILLYANEHKMHYPPDLGTLVITEEIADDAFVCPDSNTQRVDPTGLTLDQLRARVTATTDYIYLGQNLKADADQDQLVLYEKIDNHTNGMNMLFADGSVYFMLNKDADRIIAAKHRLPSDRNY